VNHVFLVNRRDDGGLSWRFLILRSFLQLILFDLYLARGNFNAVYDKVRNCPRADYELKPDAAERICAAVDMACIWYWKQVLCLQRSAATTCLLRRYGVPAQMVLGAQHVPFRAHAWVELDGQVVNDRSYMPEIYGVLDRC